VLEGLTAYDMHREPRSLILDDRTKSVPINQVSQSLTCPVCRELPTRTMTVMKCLHRFCAECIDNSLRIGNKECPTCRGECATRRALRPDTQFDQLLSRLYPDRQAYEARVDEIENEIATARQHNVLAATVREGIARQRANARALKNSARRRASHRQQVLCFRMVIGDPDLADREVTGYKPATPLAAATTSSTASAKQEGDSSGLVSEEADQSSDEKTHPTETAAEAESATETATESRRAAVSTDADADASGQALEEPKKAPSPQQQEQEQALVRAELYTLRWVQTSAAASVWDVKQMLSALCEGELPASSYRVRTAQGKELTSDLGLLDLRRQASPGDLVLYIQVDR